MAELMAVRETIPPLIQTLGLIAPAIACCYAKLSREAGMRYVTSKGKNYYNTTGIGLNKMREIEFMAHDHEIEGVKPNLKGRKIEEHELVVEIPKGGAVDFFPVKRKDLIIIPPELQPGQQIPGVETPLIHNHDGKMATGPWEHS